MKRLVRSITLPSFTDRLGVAGAAGRLWVGALAVNGSTVVVIAASARFLGEGDLAGTAAVLAMSFVVAVVPGALQLRAAAATIDGAAERIVPWRGLVSATVVLVIAVLLFGWLLHLPAAALALVSLQLIPAAGTAARRGSLLGARRFGAVGRSLGVEAAVRVVVGTVLTISVGPAGLAVGLVTASSVAWLLTAAAVAGAGAGPRPATSLLQTSLSLGALALFVNLDLLVAPRVLGDVGADRYGLAAVPAKGVFVALIAVGWLAFPHAREVLGRRAVVVPILGTVGLGLVLTTAVVVARPAVEFVLDGPPDPTLLIILGVAMASAAGTSVAVNLAVARGQDRPWQPLLVPISALVFGALWAGNQEALALMVVLAHLAGLGWFVYRNIRPARAAGRPHGIAGPARF